MSAGLRRLTYAACALLLLPPGAVAAQGRVVVDTLHARTLEGNRLGEATARAVYVYLPPAYDREPARRFPVLYLLHGMTSHPTEWLDGSYQGFDLRAAMDALVAAGGTEFLVVMPHADNAMGGPFYVNSTAFGRWDDLVSDELVRFVDGRWRTLADRAHRGLAGQSMGGFGALSVAWRHPDRFGSVYAMSACCLGFVGDLAPESPAWRGEARATGLVAMAAAFAPDDWPAAEGPRPFVPDGRGGNREERAVADRWRRHLPLELVSREPTPFRAYCAIALDFGVHDAVASVEPGSRAFAGALARVGIAYLLDAYEGGHVDRARERFERHLLPFFSRVLAPGGCAVR